VEGQKTLLEIISLAGGFRDDSGYEVKIVRRRQYGPLDLPGEGPDETGRFHVGQVDLDALLEAKKPEYNIFVQPHDVITVPRARMVYVIGEVDRAGGFVLRERESVSVLQALALAGGLGRSPAMKKAKILRPGEEGVDKLEIPLDLKLIMAGSATDVELRKDDTLFVPRSGASAAAKAAARAAVAVGSGITIWRVGDADPYRESPHRSRIAAGEPLRSHGRLRSSAWYDRHIVGTGLHSGRREEFPVRPGQGASRC